MKHFRTFLITAFCTFFTTVHAQNIQRDQVIEFDVDTYFGDIAPADDAGLFVAGYMGHSDGAGYVVYCDHQMYVLSPSLDSAVEIVKDDLWKFNVHPINGGYLALEHSGSQSYLHRWNGNLETVSSLQLRQDLDIYPWIHSLNYFFVQDDHFNLSASLLPLHQGNAVWLISSPLAASGDWQTATDLVVTDITFSGIPTGEITGVFPAVPPANQYNVDYTNVSVEVKNTGTDTIQHFFINFRANACEPTTCYHPEWIWRRSYDSTDIAPGETRILAFDSIHISCTTMDIKRFCVWASDVNHQSDNAHYDNLGCVDLPGIVSTDDVPAGLAFSIAPNPVRDILTIQLPDERRIKSIRLFSPDGRSVREVSGNSTTIFMGDLPAGIYMTEVISESGGRGWRRVVR